MGYDKETLGYATLQSYISLNGAEMRTTDSLKIATSTRDLSGCGELLRGAEESRGIVVDGTLKGKVDIGQAASNPWTPFNADKPYKSVDKEFGDHADVIQYEWKRADTPARGGCIRGAS
jgi:hypothetical protein